MSDCPVELVPWQFTEWQVVAVNCDSYVAQFSLFLNQIPEPYSR